MENNSIFDLLTNALVEFLISIIDLLPDNPFTIVEEIQAPATVVMSYVNWFIDFPTILNITMVWVFAVFGWYCYRVILRWANLAGG